MKRIAPFIGVALVVVLGVLARRRKDAPPPPLDGSWDLAPASPPHQ